MVRTGDANSSAHERDLQACGMPRAELPESIDAPDPISVPCPGIVSEARQNARTVGRTVRAPATGGYCSFNSTLTTCRTTSRLNGFSRIGSVVRCRKAEYSPPPTFPVMKITRGTVVVWRMARTAS